MSYYDYASMIVLQLGPYRQRPEPLFDLPKGSSVSNEVAAAMQTEAKRVGPRIKPAPATTPNGPFARMAKRLRTLAMRRQITPPA